MSEDFPTPEDPRSAVVPPVRTISRNSAIPAPVTALATTMRTPIEAFSASPQNSETRSQRSTLLSTTMGRAPLSHVRARYRSIRRELNSRFRELTRKTVSTFAATICSSVFLPAVLRENFPFRSNMKWIVDRVPRSSARTQSPTAGSISREIASWRNLPRNSAQLSRLSEMILYKPRFSSLTLARTNSLFCFCFHCCSKKSHQPNSCNENTEISSMARNHAQNASRSGGRKESNEKDCDWGKNLLSSRKATVVSGNAG